MMKTTTTTTMICRKCGIAVTDANRGSISDTGKATCLTCLGKDLGVDNVVLPAGSTSVKISAKNTTARANPALAPKPVAPKIAPVATIAPKAVLVVLDATKQALFDAIVALHVAGKKPAEIAELVKVTYGVVKVQLWFNKWMGTAPGCTGYTSVARADAQKRYEADVVANKLAKAAKATPATPAPTTPSAE